jgi:hypothetical protein
VTNLVIPARFNLAHYRLTLEALEDLHLPPFKGSALRGGFGHTFKRLACMEPHRCDTQCRRGNGCAYGYIFETAPPTSSEVLSNLSEVPRPFIIAPADDRREVIQAGQRLNFGLTLIGQGIHHLPYFLVVFKEMGATGLGKNRGKYQLLTVDGASPYGGRRYTPIYQAPAETIQADDVSIDGAVINQHAGSLGATEITLEFVTPTRIKHQDRWVWEGPPFAVLVRSLLGRVSSLSYFHCGAEWKTDYRGVVDQAAEVSITRSETHWEDWSRFSTRQKQRIEMGGLVGQVTYSGNLTPYLPLLAAGELVHVGKGTVFGNGQYHILGA